MTITNLLPNTVNQELLSGVALTVKDLSDQQLAVLYNSVTFPGVSPKLLPFYKDVEGLFTEDDGEKMHQEMLNALGIVVYNRLEK